MYKWDTDLSLLKQQVVVLRKMTSINVHVCLTRTALFAIGERRRKS